MDDRAQLLERIATLEAENRRLRSDVQRLWPVREQLWDRIEVLLEFGTWVWNVATRDIEWSRNLYRVLGYDPETTPVTEAAETFDQAIHPDDLESYHEGQERALRGEVDEPTRFRFIRPDGKVIHVVLLFAPAWSEDGSLSAFAGAILDVTERVDTHGAALRAERLEAIGRVAGGVAHDFNNLLMIIAGNAELLLLDDPDNERARQIVGAVEVGASLTGQLLSFTRQTASVPTPVVLDTVVSRTVPLVERLLREDIRVEVELASEDRRIKVDPGQLQTAIVNLAVNARDAMPSGGALTFRTSHRPLSDPAGADASDEAPREGVVLSVTDTGVGMDESVVARIFDPFFTTKDGSRGPQGTGLGLASVRAFVRGAGGDVHVHSVVGQGTTIELHFPRTTEALIIPENSGEQAPLKSGEVLVVEDSAGIRRVLIGLLRRSGLEPVVYPNANDALVDWPRLKRRVRVLITDVVMPGLSGHELAIRLREDRPDLGVVIITGYDPTGTPLEHSAFLRKPFTRRQLVEALEEVSPAKVIDGGE